jgi:hypothetical protein
LNLNALIRGQSNALMLMEAGGWVGYGTIVQRVQELLGFDGVEDTVTLEYAAGAPDGANTVNSGTAFLGDWIGPDGQGGWETRGHEQGLLDYIGALPDAQREEPTAVVWLHSEYDSRDWALTPETWESGVRYDAALVRDAYGQTAAELPYLFVSAIPYWGSDTGHQAIREGMESLADDPAFHGGIAARALDIDMSNDDLDGNWQTTDPGGPHMSAADAAMVAERIALSLAQEWAAYAKPGSPVALAGGQVNDLGPEVIAAAAAGPDQLLLTVGFDAAERLAALDADAATGLGWTVFTSDGAARHGTAVALEGADTLRVTFDGPVATGDSLFYGWGYGRLAGADGTGAGNAIYDDQGLPIWVAASGLTVGAPPGAGSGGGGVAPDRAELQAGGGPDTLVLQISQDAFEGDATYTVAVNGAQVGGVLTATALHDEGASDTLTLRGDWAPGPLQVTVTLTNDLWVPGLGDRNIYATGATYGGETNGALGSAWYGGSFTIGTVDDTKTGSGGSDTGSDPAQIDWNAVAAAATAYYEATGQWYGGDPADLLAPPGGAAAEPPPPPAAVDWDAMAAEVTRNFAESGSWYA